MSGGLGDVKCIVLIVALFVSGFGCTTVVRRTSATDYPHDGVHLLYSRDSRLIQKTVWRQDKLVVAWEYRRSDLPFEVIDAVNRGERTWPSPRWIQVVRKGNGRITYLDEDGNIEGFAEYDRGDFYRGAH